MTQNTKFEMRITDEFKNPIVKKTGELLPMIWASTQLSETAVYRDRHYRSILSTDT